jgi:hypothetical protein
MMRALTVLWLSAGAAAFAGPRSVPPPPGNEAAQCLKRCAGEPKDARGERLLACLERCESQKQPDAGTP